MTMIVGCVLGRGFDSAATAVICETGWLVGWFVCGIGISIQFEWLLRTEGGRAVACLCNLVIRCF